MTISFTKPAKVPAVAAPPSTEPSHEGSGAVAVGAPKPKLNGKSELMEVLAKASKDKGREVYVAGHRVPNVERIPTGLFEFDLATGGGVPRGRMSLFYGRESSGKSNLAYLAAGTVQQQDRIDNKAVLIDLEGTFDPIWASNFLDPEELIVVKPAYGEEASDLFDAVVHAEDVGIVIVDSVTVMSASRELDKSAEDFAPGRNAFLLSEMTRKLTWALCSEQARGHCPAVIYINQPRMKMNTMHPTEYIPGGDLQKFISSLTVKLTGRKKVEKAIDPLNPAYNETECEIKKSKVPVTRTSFKYDMALLAQPSLTVGQTNSWHTVMTALKNFEVLKKVGADWVCAGKAFPTLAGFQALYEKDRTFAIKLQQMVVGRSMTGATTVG